MVRSFHIREQSEGAAGGERAADDGRPSGGRREVVVGALDMAAGRPPFLTARKVRILDVTVVVWVVVWVLLGALIGRAIWDVGAHRRPR